MKKAVVLVFVFLLTSCVGGRGFFVSENRGIVLPEGQEVHLKGEIVVDSPEGFERRELTNGFALRNGEAEMNFTSRNNDEGFTGLSDLVAQKYPGFTVSFRNNGVVVDEGGEGGYSVRHFFLLQDEMIYEASLRLKSEAFSRYEAVFDEVLESMRFE